jgi:hypothetical protein
MTDQILLYRDDDMIADSNINIDSLKLKSKDYPAYSHLKVAANFDFYTNAASYDLPMSFATNEIGLTNSSDKYVVPSSGIYMIMFYVACTNASDAKCSFKIYHNNSAKTSYISERNVASSCVIQMEADDSVSIKVEQISGDNLVTINGDSSYMYVYKLR